MKNHYSVYITVRIDYESERDLDGNDVQNLVSELDYNFKSQAEGIEITDTEICDINE